MVKITTNDFKKGMYIMFRDEPHQVVDFSHSYVGRGSAHMSAKLKNIRTGKTLQHTFQGKESVEQAEVNVREMQYLYAQGMGCVFMDGVSYEQFSLPKKSVGEFSKFLKEGESYQVLVLDEEPITLRPPKKVILTVTEAPDGAKGNTATGATKTVTVETGVSVNVPLFIKTGDKIVVNPESGEYVERA